MEQSRISRWQFFLIAMQTTLGNSMIIMSRKIVDSGRQDAWLIPLIAGAAGILFSMLWVYLSALNPGLDLVQVAVRTMGKAGWIVGLAYIWFFMYVCAWTFRNLGEVVNITLMRYSPAWLFQATFVLIAAYAVTKGIEAIARTVEVFVPIILIMFVLLIFIVTKEWDWGHFAPALQTNIFLALKKSNLLFAFPFMESVCLAMLLPYAAERTGKPLYLGLGAASFILGLLVFINIGVMGISRTPHLTYPIFTMAQEMQLSEFIEHLESVVSMIWLISLFIKICIFFYCAVSGLCRLFRIRSRGVVALSIALYVTGLANSLGHNFVEDQEWSGVYGLPFDSIFAVWLPLLLIALSKFRGKKGKAG